MRKPVCARDREVGRIAWQFFKNNTQPTGLVNATDSYPSTTAWDTASSLAAILAARELDLISRKEGDDRLSALLGALATEKLYRDELPNKAYHTQSLALSNYDNTPAPNGIGYSALDVSRLLSWLDLTACLQPQHRFAVEQILARYNYCRLVKDGQLHGAVLQNDSEQSVQEGRTGYEQYGARSLATYGFQVPKAARYHNEWSQEVKVEGVPLLADKRDPKTTGGWNWITSESYVLDAMENGADKELAPLLRDVLEAQRRRWARTGLPTAASEDHLDRAPWFMYGSLWTDGVPWASVSEAGQDLSALRQVSVKASFALSALFPDQEYPEVLVGTVQSAHDPAKGWYSGVFERGYGYDRALTSNTNGVILESLLYKMYGPLRAACKRCKAGARLPPPLLDEKEALARCMPKTSKAP